MSYSSFLPVSLMADIHPSCRRHMQVNFSTICASKVGRWWLCWRRSAWPHFAVDSLAGQRDGCVWRTDYGSGDEISATLPAGHLGRADRRMEGLLAGWLGQRAAVLLGDGDQGEELKTQPVLDGS